MAEHHSVGDFDSVHVGLMEIEFLDCKLFGNNAVRVSGDGDALIEHILVSFLDFGLPYRLVADHPGHLFGNIIGSG